MSKVLRLRSHYLNVADPFIIPMIFIFLSCYEGLIMRENSVMKIQNLVVNHESQPVKSNPDIYIYYTFL